MSKLDLIEELFSYPEHAFSEHLCLADNPRILFSGRYGIGKTTFLDYFFKDSEKAEQYNAVHIFPVNYQIARNEDILEYIKYDIIAHLLSVEVIEFEKSDYTPCKSIPFLLAKRPADLIAPLLHFFGGAGKAYENYRKLLNEVFEEYEEQQKDEQKIMLKYLEQQENQQGSIYDNDFYTELISKLLLKWKENNQADNILIIDDLDRIDPRHAFRLFNIFSAHFDHREEQLNKFGFDKVIFVCDLQNIRNIFAHNYGSDVDFSGYIDKFYSKHVFEFDNSEAVKKIVKPCVNELVFRPQYEHYSPKLNSNKKIRTDLEVILNTMLKANSINLRSLLKFYTKNQFSYKYKLVEIDSSTSFYNWQQHIVVVLDILVKYIGSPTDLMIAFDKCEKYIENNYNDSQNRIWVLESVFALIYFKKGRLNAEKIRINEKLSCTFKVQFDGYQHEEIFGDVTETDMDQIKQLNIFTLYKQALEYLISLGYY